MSRKTDNWSEQEVLALPAGEHDYFDRKSGRVLADRQSLGKAVSAFANSGGGHLVIGVEDDGTLSGAEHMNARTPTRDWLEQILPNTVQPELADFRVHQVLPATPSAIDAGRVVLVVDISDSFIAPHQEVVGKVYYYRRAGRSEPAPHFYLEALRSRITGPQLSASLKSIQVRRKYAHGDGFFVEGRLLFHVTNNGNSAAYRWTVAISGLEGGRVPPEIILDPSQFPKPRAGDGGTPLDVTILPSLTGKLKVPVGLKLPIPGGPLGRTDEALNRLFPVGLTIGYRVVSEFSAGEVIRTELHSLNLAEIAHDIDLTQAEST